MLRNIGIVLLATIFGGLVGGRLGWLSVTGQLVRWQLPRYSNSQFVLIAWE